MMLGQSQDGRSEGDRRHDEHSGGSPVSKPRECAVFAAVSLFDRLGPVDGVNVGRAVAEPRGSPAWIARRAAQAARAERTADHFEVPAACGAIHDFIGELVSRLSGAQAYELRLWLKTEACNLGEDDLGREVRRHADRITAHHGRKKDYQERKKQLQPLINSLRRFCQNVGEGQLLVRSVPKLRAYVSPDLRATPEQLLWTVLGPEVDRRTVAALQVVVNRMDTTRNRSLATLSDWLAHRLRFGASEVEKTEINFQQRVFRYELRSSRDPLIGLAGEIPA